MFIGTSQNSQIVKSQQTVGQLIWKCPKSSINLSLQTTSFPCSYHVTEIHSWHTETWVVKNPSPLLSSQTPPPWTRTSLPGVQLQPVPDTKGRRPNLEIIWNHQTGPSPNFDIWDKGNIAVSPSFTYSIYFGYYIPHQKSSHHYWIIRCEGRESLQTFIYHWVGVDPSHICWTMACKVWCHTCDNLAATAARSWLENNGCRSSLETNVDIKRYRNVVRINI